MKIQKKFFKRVGAFALSLVTAVSCLASTATAVNLPDTKNTQYTINGWGYDFRGSGLPPAYDPAENGKTDSSFSSKWSNSFYYYKDSQGKYCYCTQNGVNNVDSVKMKQFPKGKELMKYYPNNTQLSHLGYATIYAYKGESKYGYSAATEIVASQCLIWAISGQYYNSQSVTLSGNESKLLKCIKAPTSKDWSNMVSCYKKMKADVLSHLDFPKGTTDIKLSNTLAKVTYKLHYDNTAKRWKATIPMDSTLSQYTVATMVSGVTFTKSGNNLIVTATDQGMKDLKTTTVQLIKSKAKYAKKIDKTSLVFQAVKSNSGKSQYKVSYCTKDDPVFAYLKLTADVGTLNVRKLFANGEGETIEAAADLRKDVKFVIFNANGHYVSKSGSNGSYQYRGTNSTITGYETFILSSDSTFRIANLPSGRYRLREISAPESYKKSADFVFNIENGKIVNKHIINNLKEDTIDYGKNATDENDKEITNKDQLKEIYKECIYRAYVIEDGTKKYISAERDEDSTKPFVYHYKGLTDISEATKLTLNSSDLYPAYFGKGRLKNIPESFNKVYFEEISSYHTMGYEEDKIQISENGADVEFNNRTYYYNAGFDKLSDNGEHLSGGLFGLYTEDGKLLESKSAEGKMTYFNVNLVPEKAYYIQEIEAPDGFIKNAEKNYIRKEMPTALVKAKLANVTVKLENKPITFEISKQDVYGNELPGAEMQLLDSEGKIIEEWTSEDKPHVVNKLPAGEYVLHEEAAPTGFAIATDIKITIEDNGTVKQNGIEVTAKSEDGKPVCAMIDNAATGEIQIRKTTKGQLNIEGIEFILSGTSDIGIEVNETAKTDKNGIARFTNVPVGTYSVTENGKTVPTAYLVSDGKEVNVMYAQTTTLEINNEEKTGSIKIQKTTKGMKNIEGIEFILSGTSDSGREVKITAKTDKNGVANFTDIPVGTYSITENGKTVPTGYLVADEQEVTVSYAQTTTVKIENKEKPKPKKPEQPEKPEKPEQPEKPDIPNTPDTPDTGLAAENDLPAYLVAAAAVLGAGALILAVRGRKKDDK